MESANFARDLQSLSLQQIMMTVSVGGFKQHCFSGLSIVNELVVIE